MRVQDNLLDEPTRKRVNDFVNLPGWEWGWRSNVDTDIDRFWHKHYAGHRKIKDTEPYDCTEELRASAPLLHSVWQLLQPLLVGHKLIRCYANGFPYGVHGRVHLDSKDDSTFTLVYYPHEKWLPDWGGETVFFNKDKTDIIGCVYPKPNRAILFPGTIPHVARGVSRICPTLRVTLMFKTKTA